MENRTIKFRAWDKERKRMYRVQKILFGAAGEGAFQVEGIAFNPTQISTMNICEDECGQKTPHCILMQFTGLLDKNGTEIHEGDIVKYNWTISDRAVVVWDDILFKWAGEVGKNMLSLGGRKWKEFEVIGNVWENPELLK